VIGGVSMLYITAIIVFVIVLILLYLILSFLNRDKILIKNRVIQVKEIHDMKQDETKVKSLSENALIIIYNFFSRRLLRMTPDPRLSSLNKRLEKAGLLKNKTAEKWLFDKYMSILIACSAFSLLTYMLIKDIVTIIIFVPIIFLLVNTIFNFHISRKTEKRKKIILKDLPFILDLITVSVEAGLSFDGAISRVVNSISGELCDEYGKSLKEIRMGIPRKTALKNMSERCAVKELFMLNTSIIQADELGVSLGNVLRIESENLREHIKQLTREKAMKVPIKMLFPLIFFIFPSIFIVILGPAVIKIYNMFMR
jgi:tight adherence protein C